MFPLIDSKSQLIFLVLDSQNQLTFGTDSKKSIDFLPSWKSIDCFLLSFLVFFPAIVATVTFFEVLDRTCIVYAYLGIKNMGDKYQKEREDDSLKVQRMQSFKIVIKALVAALLITGIVYLVWSRNL